MTESREELISAYLDGELPPERCAEVEAWLAESPRLRQLHDELRALRAQLKTLPRHELDHDLQGAVLRRAEQAVLRGGDARPSVHESPEGVASWWNRGAGWRRVIWPAIAVAAALLIVLLDPGQRATERQVAQQPAEREASGRSGGAISAPPAPRDGPSWEPADVPPGAAGRDQREESPAPPAAMPEQRVAPADAPAFEDDARARSAEVAKPKAAVLAQQAWGGEADVVIEVTSEYLSDNTFEKLLDAHHIKWQRSGVALREGGAVTAQQALPKPVDRYFNLAENGTGVSYLIDATPEQAEALLRRLERAVVLRKRLGQQADRPAEQAQQPAARRMMITLVAPAEAAAPASRPEQAAPPAAAP